MKLDSINAEQRLYVMKCGEGYSCYGFEVLDRKARAVAQYCGVPTPESLIGTREHFEECAVVMGLGQIHARKTGTRCNAELSAQLLGLEGKRVEVVDCYGETRRFIVGKSTGWMPCHLEIPTRRASGGPAVTGAPFKSLTILKR